MEYLLYFYIIFTYLFAIGAKLDNNYMPIWNIVFAPITVPILIGNYFSNTFNK